MTAGREYVIRLKPSSLSYKNSLDFHLTAEYYQDIREKNKSNKLYFDLGSFALYACRRTYLRFKSI